MTSNTSRLGLVDGSGRGTSAAVWNAWGHSFPGLDISSWSSVVVLAPHPDDEVLGVGGLMARLAASGVDVRVVGVTDGGGARPPVGMSVETLDANRATEAAAGCRVLGVETPVRLRLPDGRVAAHETALTAQIADVLSDDCVCLTTWAFDGHPDHEAVGRAAARAGDITGTPVVAYPVWMWHWSHPGDPLVPWESVRTFALTDAERDLKRTAVDCHRSQLDPPYPGGSPVLPSFVIDRLVTSRETLIL